MNQILATNNNQEPEKKPEISNNIYKTSGGKKDIGIVTKVFAIIIILVSLSIVGIGIYMYNDMGKNPTVERANQPPVIKQETLEENKVKISVAHDKELKQASYMWGSSNQIPIECEGKKEIELTVDMPLGKNTFTFSVEDTVGEKSVFEREFNVEYGVEISINGNKTIIEAKSEDTFEYMTYRWNMTDETKIEIGKSEFLQEIDTPKGENILTVAFVDSNNETIQKVQTIQGILEPSVTMEYEGENILFKLEDEEQLQKFMVFKNGEKIYNKDLDEALFEYTLEKDKFKHTDKIEASATNINGVETKISRPVLSVKYDETGDNIEIKAKDDIALNELKVTINDNEPQVGNTTNKEFKYLYPVKDLKHGDSMKIEVTNSKNVLNQITVKLK